ncbi:DUF5412 family protein [Caloranaerobacter sp. DY30410]|uniref:DUF5412 family protein n=1 Tax=Caloranaerobacter sp. DY30410 TaxID=3238305 RepID=UPI003D05D664
MRRIVKIVLLVIIIIFLIKLSNRPLVIYFDYYDPSSLFDGELVKEVYSPNKQYIAKAYIIEGKKELTIKVELVNTKTKKIKVIYWSWDEGSDPIIKWLDDEYILINGRKMNVKTNVFYKKVDPDDKYKETSHM